MTSPTPDNQVDRMTPDTSPRAAVMTAEHVHEFDETMMYLPSDLDSSLMREIESLVRELAAGNLVAVPRNKGDLSDSERLDLLERLLGDERLEIDAEAIYLWVGEAPYVCDKHLWWGSFRELAEDRANFYEHPTLYKTGREPAQSTPTAASTKEGK